MGNPRLRVPRSGLGGSGYVRPALVGEHFKEVKNSDGDLIKAWVNAEGKPQTYAGVTTVIGDILNKDTMLSWAVRLTLNWANDNWTYLGTHADEQVERAGLYRWKDVRDERSDIGSSVHNWIEAFANDWFDYPDLDDEAAQCVQQFLYFYEQIQPSVLATEVTVFHHGLGYMGTFDAIAQWGDKLRLVDWKSSKGLYWNHEMQLAALTKAEGMYVEREDGFWEEAPMPEFDAVNLVQVRPDYWDPRTKQTTPAFWHIAEIPEDEWPLHFEAFSGILAAAKVKRELKRVRKDRPENF